MIAPVSIRIPIFNQPEKLAHCLESIEKQTIVPSEIILIDDDSSIEYSNLLNRFNHLPIKYLKNKENLGAVHNMINAIYYPCEYSFLLVFHEDDYLHPQFIEFSLKALDSNPTAIFCCSNISFFFDYSEIQLIPIGLPTVISLKKEQYIEEIIKGKTIGFGTIVYRTSRLRNISFGFEKYSVLGDRPFLAELVANNIIIYINENLYAAYDHSDSDNRWLKITEQNVYNLHLYYKQQLKVSAIKQNIAGFTHRIISTYNLIPPQEKKSSFNFYYKCWKEGIFSIKYYFLTYKFVRKLVELIYK